MAIGKLQSVNINRGWLGALIECAAVLACPAARGAADAPVPPPSYEQRADHDPDGIGKFYLGREIAQVMGHTGMAWLERPEREQEEHPELLIPLLGLKAGDVVADIGAGSGYHTRRLAHRVIPRGLVYAVDIQTEMLDELGRRMIQEGITNVRPVLGTLTDPQLPTNAVDLALLVDVYHEFSHPYEMVQALCQALKPGGRLVLVEFRANDPQVPIKPLHTMSEAQVRREMAVHPLGWVDTVETLPWQRVFVFRRTNHSQPIRSPD